MTKRGCGTGWVISHMECTLWHCEGAGAPWALGVLSVCMWGGAAPKVRGLLWWGWGSRSQGPQAPQVWGLPQHIPLGTSALQLPLTPTHPLVLSSFLENQSCASELKYFYSELIFSPHSSPQNLRGGENFCSLQMGEQFY